MIRTLSLAPLLTTVAVAQTFVVDQSGAPGTHFTDLAVATATVPSGSVLIVYPGNYGAFTIDNKALTMSIHPFAWIGPDAQGRWCSIVNTAPTQNVLVQGISLVVQGVPYIANCAGPVVLMPATATSSGFTASSSVHDFVVLDSTQVTLKHASVAGRRFVVQDSSVTLEHCTVGSQALNPTFPALVASNSTVHLVATSVRGQDGSAAPWPFSPYAGSPAIELASASLRIAGDGAHAITGGLLAIAPGRQPPFIGTGTVRIDPAVQQFGPTPPAGVQITVLPLPWLDANDPTFGQPLQVTRFGTGNTLFAIVLASPGPATIWPGIQQALWFDPPQAQIVSVGVGPTPNGHTVQLTLPVHTPGTQFVWQAIDFPATGSWDAGSAARAVVL